MNKRKLAQVRNWFKFQLMGLSFAIRHSMYEKYLSETEKMRIDEIMRLKELLLRDLDQNSKNMGLKIRRP